MLALISFLPRMFQFFGLFQSMIGFVLPLWPFVAGFFNRGRAVA